MIIIAFWSYKGGTGRSLAVANTAYALSRLGKSLAVLDADLGAPGLPYKFGVKRFSSKQLAILRRGGFVDLVYSRVRDEPGERTDVTRYACPIRFEGRGEDPAGGLVHFFAAGNIETGYWTLQGEIMNRFRRLVEGPANRAKMENAFVGIREDIERQLKPVPEYLLVDLPSGVNDLQTMILNSWADKVVTLFVHNDEGVDAVQSILPKIQGIPRDGRSVQVIPVLSRVPPALYKQVGFSLEQLAEAYGLRQDDISIVHEDRYLELSDETVLNSRRTNPLLYRQVANDYVELIARIMTEEDPETDRNLWSEKRRWHTEMLRDRLGISPGVFQEEQVFALYRRQGEVVNIVDNERNVSFKVETFNELLAAVWEAVAAAAKEHNEKRSTVGFDAAAAFGLALERAGEAVGQSFGEALGKVWVQSGVNYSPWKRIDNWCEFDSAAGWGTFRCEPKSEDDGPKAGFVIVVVNNFLAMGLSKKRPRLCSLMKGYIKGVAVKILETGDVDVEHLENNCIRDHHNEKRGCIFTVSSRSSR